MQRADAGKNKRRRRILLASTAGGGVIVGAAATLTDEAKYIGNAAQRTGRVVSTLFININEYVV